MRPWRRLRHLGRLVRDVTGYAWRHRAWWLVPVVAVLLLLALLVVVGSQATVFVYAIF